MLFKLIDPNNVLRSQDLLHYSDEKSALYVQELFTCSVENLSKLQFRVFNEFSLTLWQLWIHLNVEARSVKCRRWL